jgi:hypothetical protein
MEAINSNINSGYNPQYISVAECSESAANASCYCKPCFTKSSLATEGTHRDSEGSEESSPPRSSVAVMMVAVAAGGREWW